MVKLVVVNKELGVAQIKLLEVTLEVKRMEANRVAQEERLASTQS